jgi:hypothetical protein
MLSFAEFRKQRLQKSFGSNVFENIDKRFDVLKINLLEASASRPLTESYDYRANYILDRILEDDARFTRKVIDTYVEYFRGNVHAMILENAVAGHGTLEQNIKSSIKKFIDNVKRSVTSQLAQSHGPVGAAGVAADNAATPSAPGGAPAASGTPDPNAGQSSWNTSQQNHYLGRNSTYQSGQPQAGPQGQPQGGQPQAGAPNAQATGGSKPWYDRKSNNWYSKWMNVPKTAFKWLRGAYRGDYLDDHTIQKLATLVETIFHENDTNLLASIDQFGQELEREILGHLTTYMQSNPAAGTSPAAPPQGIAPPSSDVAATPGEDPADGAEGGSRRGMGTMTADRYKANIDKIKQGAWVHPTQLFSMVKQDYESGKENANPSASYLDKINYFRDLMKMPRMEKAPERPTRDPAVVDQEISVLKGKTPDEQKSFVDKQATTGAGRKRLRDMCAVMGLELPKRGSDVRVYLSKADEIVAKLATYEPKPADPAAPTAPQNSADVANLLGTAKAEPSSMAGMDKPVDPTADPAAAPTATDPAAPPGEEDPDQGYDDFAKEIQKSFKPRTAEPVERPDVATPRTPPSAPSDPSGSKGVFVPHTREPEPVAEPEIDPAHRQEFEPTNVTRSIADVDNDDEAGDSPTFDSPSGPSSIEVKADRVKSRVAELDPHLAYRIDRDPNVDNLIKAHADLGDDELARLIQSVLKGGKAPESAPTAAAAPEAPPTGASWDDMNGMLDQIQGKLGNKPLVRDLVSKKLKQYQSEGMSPDDAVSKISDLLLGAKPKPVEYEDPAPKARKNAPAIQPDQMPRTGAPAAAPSSDSPFPEAPGASPAAAAAPAAPARAKSSVHWYDEDGINDLLDQHMNLRMFGQPEQARFRKELERIRDMHPDAEPDQAVRILADKFRPLIDKKKAEQDRFDAHNKADADYEGDLRGNLGDKEDEEVPTAKTGVDDEGNAVKIKKKKSGPTGPGEDDDPDENDEAIRTRAGHKHESAGQLIEQFRQKLRLRLG